VTTLHEIGHAVDAKFKIMETHGKNADHGGWSTHTVDQVAQIVFDDFTGSTALINVNPATLLGEIKDALANGDTRRLDGAFPEEADWAKIGPLLVKCAGLRENSPWQRTVKVGAKAYHRAYEDGRWVGYDPAAKTSTFVHSYQWRSPGEWFAELYAITWLAKKAPPAGVGAAAAAYLWGGASIGTR
jgi:hypothetical protein